MLKLSAYITVLFILVVGIIAITKDLVVEGVASVFIALLFAGVFYFNTRKT